MCVRVCARAHSFFNSCMEQPVLNKNKGEQSQLSVQLTKWSFLVCMTYAI